VELYKAVAAMVPMPKRIVVLGAGAIGASVGALLFRGGVPCVLVARGEHGRALREQGLDLRLADRALRILVPTVSSLSEAAVTEDDLVLLATMGQHTSSALAELPKSVHVASFQNGTVPLDQIVTRGHPLIAAMVYVPAERRGPGTIALSGVPVFGSVILGGYPSGGHPWAPWLAEELQRAGFRAEIEPELAPWIRAKLLVNLGGIVAALCDEPCVDVTERAQAEARAVWQATRRPFCEPEALLSRVGPLSAEPVDNIPRVGGSTRAALARGDALETECLHAGIVETGLETGVPTPVNAALIRVASQAAKERWSPGHLTAAALRELVA
jgi:2-dehydropantoate 2-reductase